MKEINPQLEQDTWDKRKIFLFVLALIILVGAGAYAFKNADFLNIQKLPVEESQKEVKGTGSQTENNEAKKTNNQPSFNNIQNTFQDKFNDIKKEAEKINVTEVASSSPQVQKVINDIKSLQNYPRNQAKEACFNICEGL